MSTKPQIPTPKRPIRLFAVREKLDAIQRVHEGESKALVDRDIGVPESTLRGWCKQEDKLRLAGRTCGSPDTENIERDTSDTSIGGPSDRKRTRIDEPEDDPKTLPDLWSWLKRQEQQVGGQIIDARTTNCSPPEGSWFWQWYKAHGVNSHLSKSLNIPPYLPLTHVPNSENKPPFQKLNGYTNHDVLQARSTLDSVLLNLSDNNNVKKEDDSDEDDTEDDPPATAAEAVVHGEKFLRWLECCSDPSITTMQILRFRYLLNSVRECAQHKAKQNKTKTHSRRK